MTPLIEAIGISRHFPLSRSTWLGPRPFVRAVDDVSFAIHPGEVVGLVGESGSGKSTIGNMLLRFDAPTHGAICFRGEDITHLPERRLKEFRRSVQPVFQDPYGSLNPRMTVEQIVGEPLAIHGLEPTRAARRQRVVELLNLAGLGADHLARYPHQFSGGQRQRIGIARALAVSPQLIIADEPIAALDVSIQAQVVNLLKSLQEKLSLAMLFIAHDLAAVRYLSNRIIVLYLGRVMEIGTSAEIVETPKHPYTEALLSAVLEPRRTRKRQRIILQGDLPSPISPPSGCVFRTRCRYALPECAKAVPALRQVAGGHYRACIRDDVL